VKYSVKLTGMEGEIKCVKLTGMDGEIKCETYRNGA